MESTRFSDNTSKDKFKDYEILHVMGTNECTL